MSEEFGKTIAAAYAAEGPTVDLGRGVHEGALAPEAVVQIPLRMMNRHGLVAGATGTGKTVTLQTIAEQLSSAGVAVFAADVKGDVSGVAVAGEKGGPAEKRMTELGLPFEPAGFPVEYLSLGGLGPGVPVRATVTDFGPQLLAKILKANQTQEDSLALVFHYADEKGLPLLDLVGPARAAHLPRVRRREGGARGHRRPGLVHRGSASAVTGGARGRRRHGVLRRAAARHRRPAPHRARRPRRDLDAGAARGSGQAQAVLDGAHVAARRALRAASGGRRSRQAEARLLLRRGAPAVRGRDRRIPRVRHPDGPPHPVEGRGHLLRDAGARRRPRRGPRPARQPRAARPARVHARRRQGAQGGGLHLSEVRLLRRRRAAHLDGDRRGGRDDPVGRGRADPRRAHQAASARLTHRPRGRRGRRRQGLAALRQVRHPGGGRERAREARGEDGGGDGRRRRRRAGGGQAAERGGQEARPGPGAFGPAPTRSGTS